MQRLIPLGEKSLDVEVEITTYVAAFVIDDVVMFGGHVWCTG